MSDVKDNIIDAKRTIKKAKNLSLKLANETRKVEKVGLSIDISAFLCSALASLDDALLLEN